MRGFSNLSQVSEILTFYLTLFDSSGSLVTALEWKYLLLNCAHCIWQGGGAINVLNFKKRNKCKYNKERLLAHCSPNSRTIYFNVSLCIVLYYSLKSWVVSLRLLPFVVHCSPESRTKYYNLSLCIVLSSLLKTIFSPLYSHLILS